MKELENLYDVISDRAKNPTEGSYTSYLFQKGKEKILKKIGEESTEAVIAAMKDDKNELIMELGDLFYHITVLMVECGVTLEELSEELGKRSQKTGNLKAERKPIENL